MNILRRTIRSNAVRGAVSAACAGLLLAACSTAAPEIKPDRPAEDLYNQAMNLLVQGDEGGAIKYFEEVERQHPYSIWANKSMLMAAYANYQTRHYNEAISALDHFIDLHPGSKDIAYAYYLRSLCYYEQIADIKRGQAVTKQAMDALQQVIRRFPHSKYATDAKLKLDLARDQLAGHEMEVGRWYERRGNYEAAINRFKRVIQDYQTTAHVPEALHRLTECYLALGLNEEARRTAAVLGHNFPGSVWYSDSYALMTGAHVRGADVETGQKSWLGRAWDSVF